MAPGLYVVLAMTAVFVAIGGDGNSATLWERFEPLVRLIRDYWPLSILVVFAAYLFGSILHAFPVTLSDKICRHCFRRTVRRKFRKFYDDEFPYKTLISEYTNTIPGYREFNDKISPNIYKSDNSEYFALINFYNYLKLSVCIGSPSTFLIIQELESRIRLFSGMFWAGLIGILVNFSLIFYVYINEDVGVWITFIISYFIISLTLVLLFGRQLPQIRGREAMHVYLAYFAYLKQP